MIPAIRGPANAPLYSSTIPSSDCSSPITRVVSGFDLDARLLEAFSRIEFAGFCLTFFITLMYCVYRSYWLEGERPKMYQKW